MMIIFVIMVMLCTTTVVQSYNVRFHSMNIRLNRSSLRMAMPSYKDAFNKAKNIQSSGNSNSNNSNKPVVEVKKPIIEKQVMKQYEDIDDGLPFDDEMYDHLKYVIGVLTARMKSEKPLTDNELKRFKVSIDAIILDSKEDSSESYDDYSNDNSYNEDEVDNYEQEEASSPLAISNNPQASSDNPFNQFRGSTWNFDNMEDMTTEEYYDALNKRLADMKQKKLEVYERDELNNPSESYFDSLSRKNKSF